MIRAWLPRFASYAWAESGDDGEFEGRGCSVTWLRWTVQITFARLDRRLG